MVHGASAAMIAMREDSRSLPTPMPARLPRSPSRGGLSRQSSRGGLSRQSSSHSLSRQPSQSELTEATLSSQYASVFLLNGLEPEPLIPVPPVTVSFGSPVRRIYSAAKLETPTSRASTSHSVRRSQSLGRLPPMSGTSSATNLRATTPGARLTQRASTPFGYETYRRRSLLEEKIIGVRIAAPIAHLTPTAGVARLRRTPRRVAGGAAAAGGQQPAPGALLHGAALGLQSCVAGAGNTARGALADQLWR